jgi:LPXTG-motif cell wall-anchored protein
MSESARKVIAPLLIGLAAVVMAVGVWSFRRKRTNGKPQESEDEDV